MEKLFSAITFTILFILFGAYTSANASAPETFDDIKILLIKNLIIMLKFMN